MESLQPNKKDNIFLRRVIVGLASFMYNSIKLTDEVDGNERIRNVRFFYSATGSEQYITDYFLNTDSCYKYLSTKVEGNVNTIPSGVFNIQSPSISTDSTNHGYTRLKHKVRIESEYGAEERDMSSRGTYVPISMNAHFKVKCTSDTERMMVWEEIVKNLYKQKKYWMRYGGFEKIPVTIMFPEGFGLDKNFEFTAGEGENRPMLEFDVDLITYLPVIDKTTTRNSGERISVWNIKKGYKTDS